MTKQELELVVKGLKQELKEENVDYDVEIFGMEKCFLLF